MCTLSPISSIGVLDAASTEAPDSSGISESPDHRLQTPPRHVPMHCCMSPVPLTGPRRKLLWPTIKPEVPGDIKSSGLPVPLAPVDMSLSPRPCQEPQDHGTDQPKANDYPLSEAEARRRDLVQALKDRDAARQMKRQLEAECKTLRADGDWLRWLLAAERPGMEAANRKAQRRSASAPAMRVVEPEPETDGVWVEEGKDEDWLEQKVRSYGALRRPPRCHCQADVWGFQRCLCAAPCPREA